MSIIQLKWWSIFLGMWFEPNQTYRENKKSFPFWIQHDPLIIHPDGEHLPVKAGQSCDANAAPWLSSLDRWLFIFDPPEGLLGHTKTVVMMMMMP